MPELRADCERVHSSTSQRFYSNDVLRGTNFFFLFFVNLFFLVNFFIHFFSPPPRIAFGMPKGCCLSDPSIVGRKGCCRSVAPGLAKDPSLDHGQQKPKEVSRSVSVDILSTFRNLTLGLFGAHELIGEPARASSFYGLQ